MPRDPKKSPYKEAPPCGWIPTEPWNVWRKVQDGTFDQRCGGEGLFNVVREEDCGLCLCAEHLVAFLFLYGPQQIEHWGESWSLANHRMRGRVKP